MGNFESHLVGVEKKKKGGEEKKERSRQMCEVKRKIHTL